jgi:phosphoglycerate dehydrogenase-like enzyme
MSSPTALHGYLRPRVRWVQLSSSGVEDWFEAGVIDGGRVWTAAKGAAAEPIAEYILATLLAAARRIPEVVAERRWRRLPPRSLRGSVVSLVGAGRIGEAALRLLAPFGAYTIAVTRSGREVRGASESVGLERLDDALRRSDYVVLATPLTPATRGLLDRPRIDALKPGAFVVNVGRGPVLDTDALYDGVRTGQLDGAALDVTDPEPLPPEHPLWTHPNVIVTSHTASTPELAWPWFLELVEENVRRFGRGEELTGTIDVAERY